MNEQHDELESAYQPRDESKERHEYPVLIPATLIELEKWGHNVDNLNPNAVQGLYLTKRDVSRGLKRWLENGFPDPRGEKGLHIVKTLMVELLLAEAGRKSLNEHTQEIQTLFDAATETRNEALEKIQDLEKNVEQSRKDIETHITTISFMESKREELFDQIEGLKTNWSREVGQLNKQAAISDKVKEQLEDNITDLENYRNERRNIEATKEEQKIINRFKRWISNIFA